MNDLLVVDRHADWPQPPAGVTRMVAADYLGEAGQGLPRTTRVYNLCRSYRYQRVGYYVSLLAAARGHRAYPDVATIQDLKSATAPRLLSESLQTHISRSLKPLQSAEFELSIYFGQNLATRHARLARALYNLFPAPLLRARFRRRGKGWQLEQLRTVALSEVPESHRDFMQQAALGWFGKRRRTARPKPSRAFDLAILCNPEEADPPSNEGALQAFEAAGAAAGFAVTRIDRDDFGALAEFDALFIRETTFVNHHTYRFSRRAALAGAVVMDDPVSILRCTNKVFLAERLARAGLPTPPTMIIHRDNRRAVRKVLGSPCVLKQPDSAFSRGVRKVETDAELATALEELFETSDLLIGQAFMPTDYDWRVGVLNGEALYVCRYFMAPEHWQIVRHESGGAKQEGEADTLPVSEAPPALIELATRAAATIGDGLYGVDIKQKGKRYYVIEINDNPSIDAGCEDAVLGAALYRRIMDEFRRRVDARVQRG